MILTELWTDGSGLATGGPGGWAFVLRAIDSETGDVLKEMESSGGLIEATNQRAEMTAVIAGLFALRRPTAVTIWTDSEYVMHGFTKGWVARWQENGWLNREKLPVANRDLWETLADGVEMHNVSWQHIKGHLKNFRCECGWDGQRPAGAKSPPRCPACQTRTTPYDVYPFNARCDYLAGVERRKLMEEDEAA